MSKILGALLLFVFLTISVTAFKTTPTVECEYGFIGDELYCYLRNIQVTAKNYKFKPKSQNNTAIKNVVIERSTIPIFGSDVCEIFINLEYLSFGPVDLYEVRPDALSKCKNLKTLSLTSNKITELDKETFKGLDKIETLYLAGNELEQLHDDLFADLKALTGLHLYFNQLTEFSTALVQNSPQLKSIFLFSNDLFNFDLDGILDALPDLDVFIFDDNNIRCSSVSRFVNMLSNRKIEYEWNGFTTKPRSISRDKVLGHYCLGNDEWNAEYQKSLIKYQAKQIELKNVKFLNQLVSSLKIN